MVTAAQISQTFIMRIECVQELGEKSRASWKYVLGRSWYKSVSICLYIFTSFNSTCKYNFIAVSVQNYTICVP